MENKIKLELTKKQGNYLVSGLIRLEDAKQEKLEEIESQVGEELHICEHQEAQALISKHYELDTQLKEISDLFDILYEEDDKVIADNK